MREYFALVLLVSCLVLTVSCKKEIEVEEVYSSETLTIKKIAENSYVHVSYLDTETYGKVPCNGAIFTAGNEAIVFETPVDDEVSNELIEFIEKDLDLSLGTVVVSHFHKDAMGGLKAFHQAGAASFANQQTIAMVKASEGEVPKYGIATSFEHWIGDQRMLSFFVGEGHTTDNIVGYFPTDKVLFGGCLIKAIGSGKGNLEDANPEAWSQTVEDLKALTSEAEIVIPGHGKVGNLELLEYTIQLFSEKK